MKNLNITTKIWLSIGIFVLGYIISTFLGQMQGRDTEAVLRDATESLYPTAQGLQESEAGFERIVKAFGDSVVVQDASGLETARRDANRLVATLNALANTPNGDPARKASSHLLASSIDRFLNDAQEIYGTVLSNPTAMTADMQQRMRDLASRTEILKANLAQARKASAAQLLSRLNELEANSESQRTLAWIVFGVTIALSFLIVHLTIRKSITGPITRVIIGVDSAAGKAKVASDTMADSGRHAAENAHRQAESIQETSASLEQISSSTRNNADRALEADRLMFEARSSMENASKSMSDLKLSMDAISQSSRQVAAVLKSIDEIAFHTNILALNAAVEAARAGTAGAGFSVVADEVRSLAKRASEAAGHSGAIIEKTMSDVLMGVELVTRSYADFETVSNRIAGCSEMASKIAASSAEQALGVEQAGKSVLQIERLTQQNAQNAEQTAQIASQLQQQVRLTRSFVDELVVVVGFRDVVA